VSEPPEVQKAIEKIVKTVVARGQSLKLSALTRPENYPSRVGGADVG
jgi:hypothetical protein